MEGKGIELAWFRDRADIMDLHIEGSGRLALPDGRQIKANFASTNSLKFKGWLSALVEAGAMPREGISHEKGKQYLLDHPEEERKIMSANRRYTFFKLKFDGDSEEGPAGTYGLPLTSWRSIAIDNNLVPMGAIAFMRTTMPDVDQEGTLLAASRTAAVFCQDTGGAAKPRPGGLLRHDKEKSAPSPSSSGTKAPAPMVLKRKGPYNEKGHYFFL